MRTWDSVSFSLSLAARVVSCALFFTSLSVPIYEMSDSAPASSAPVTTSPSASNVVSASNAENRPGPSTVTTSSTAIAPTRSSDLPLETLVLTIRQLVRSEMAATRSPPLSRSGPRAVSPLIIPPILPVSASGTVSLTGPHPGKTNPHSTFSTSYYMSRHLESYITPDVVNPTQVAPYAHVTNIYSSPLRWPLICTHHKAHSGGSLCTHHEAHSGGPYTHITITRTHFGGAYNAHITYI